MPINKQQLEARIARDLASKDLVAFNIGEFAMALAAATPGLRNQLQTAIRQRQNARIGSVVIEIVMVHLTTSRAAEAAAMLQDNALSLDDLDRWLG